MTNIFVGNLAYQITENELEAAFAQYGTVEKVNLIRDRDTGQVRGFAFVEMSSSADATNAINALNGQKLRGRSINVNEARPRAERAGSSRYEQRSNRGGPRW
jgi:cold-inducible RNA-binding protein